MSYGTPIVRGMRRNRRLRDATGHGPAEGGRTSAYPVKGKFANGWPAPDSPESVRQITDADVGHIEDGHAFGVGLSGKTEFPRRWNGQTKERVQAVIDNPQRVEPDMDHGEGNALLIGFQDGVMLRVAITKEGEGWQPWFPDTAHPLWGDGVGWNSPVTGKWEPLETEESYRRRYRV